MNRDILITSMGSISPLGSDNLKVWDSYCSTESMVEMVSFNGGEKALAAKLKVDDRALIENLSRENKAFKSLDYSVLYAIFASRQAIKNASWTTCDKVGVNLGSSRGATTLFEGYHKAYTNAEKLSSLSSPTTTLGNISSWVAQDLQANGPTISHSITCSSGLHAILNAYAWIRSGLITKFIAGASEAPLTGFTVNQLQALKIYSKLYSNTYPCQALNTQKHQNTMVLGEGAAVFCLEQDSGSQSYLAKIKGIGYSTEQLIHNTSISKEGTCIANAIRGAIEGYPKEKIDAIVTHTPGTVKGDLAELNAIKSIFKKEQPLITTNKWKLGHTLGSSGVLSLELAIMMLQNNRFIGVPFVEGSLSKDCDLKTILVNAIGFGGNAVSILISKE